MSSSPRPARSAPDPPALVKSPALGDFPYDAIPSAGAPHPSLADSVAAGAPESAMREAEARAQARQEGQREASRIFEERLAGERARVADALAQFTRDRAGYFQKVEAEVVQLALAIARKILHREAQLDPLLLAGIARVALEKIDGATGVTLRINPQDAAEWRKYLGTHLDPADMPQILEDRSLPPDRCSLETSMGTALVGLELQLKEIEHGLMDLIAARPRNCP